MVAQLGPFAAAIPLHHRPEARSAVSLCARLAQARRNLLKRYQAESEAGETPT